MTWMLTEEEREERRENMRNLCRNLEGALAEPSSDTFHRQTQLLEELFEVVLKRNLQKDIKNGDFYDEGIFMALRIQKQCMDTAKAGVVADYMRALQTSGRTSLSPHPHLPPPPIKISERNE